MAMELQCCQAIKIPSPIHYYQARSCAPPTFHGTSQSPQYMVYNGLLHIFHIGVGRAGVELDQADGLGLGSRGFRVLGFKEFVETAAMKDPAYTWGLQAL